MSILKISKMGLLFCLSLPIFAKADGSITIQDENGKLFSFISVSTQNDVVEVSAKANGSNDVNVFDIKALHASEAPWLQKAFESSSLPLRIVLVSPTKGTPNTYAVSDSKIQILGQAQDEDYARGNKTLDEYIDGIRYGMEAVGQYSGLEGLTDRLKNEKDAKLPPGLSEATFLNK